MAIYIAHRIYLYSPLYMYICTHIYVALRVVVRAMNRHSTDHIMSKDHNY